MLPARQFASCCDRDRADRLGRLVFPSPRQPRQKRPILQACAEKAGIAVLASPVAPWRGAPLRVIVAAEEPLEGELELISPKGAVAAKSGDRHGGPPYFWFAEVASPAAGKWQAKLSREGGSSGCGAVMRDIVVQRKAPPAAARGEGRLALHAA